MEAPVDRYAQTFSGIHYPPSRDVGLHGSKGTISGVECRSFAEDVRILPAHISGISYCDVLLELRNALQL